MSRSFSSAAATAAVGLLAACSHTAAPEVVTVTTQPPIDRTRVEGAWQSTFGAAEFAIDPNDAAFVTGSWRYLRQGAEVEGSLQGRLSGPRLPFTWTEPQIGAAPLRGTGEITFAEDGYSFAGRWRTDDDTRVGDWQGWRSADAKAIPSAPEPAETATTAAVAPAPAPTLAPAVSAAPPKAGPPPADVPAPLKVSILVMQLRAAGGARPELAEQLSQLLLARLDAVPGVSTISVADVEAMLGVEKVKDAAGCSDTSCAAQIGGAMGTDVVLYGQLGRIGSQYSVNLNLVDARANAVRGRVAALCPYDDDALVSELEGLVSGVLARLNTR